MYGIAATGTYRGDWFTSDPFSLLVQNCLSSDIAPVAALWKLLHADTATLLVYQLALPANLISQLLPQAAIGDVIAFCAVRDAVGAPQS